LLNVTGGAATPADPSAMLGTIESGLSVETLQHALTLLSLVWPDQSDHLRKR